MTGDDTVEDVTGDDQPGHNYNADTSAANTRAAQDAARENGDGYDPVTVAITYVEELLNNGSIGMADDIVAEDYTLHDPALPQDVRGRDELKQLVEMFRDAFSDFHVDIKDAIVEDGKVALRTVKSGTHTGTLMDIGPTNRRINVDGIVIHHVKEGKIVETWANYDASGMMRQVGLLTSPDDVPWA